MSVSVVIDLRLLRDGREGIVQERFVSEAEHDGCWVSTHDCQQTGYV